MFYFLNPVPQPMKGLDFGLVLHEEVLSKPMVSKIGDGKQSIN